MCQIVIPNAQRDDNLLNSFAEVLDLKLDKRPQNIFNKHLSKNLIVHGGLKRYTSKTFEGRFCLSVCLLLIKALSVCCADLKRSVCIEKHCIFYCFVL